VLWLLLEVLIVFQRPPVATPRETMLSKEAIGQVVVCDFIFEGACTIDVGSCRSGLDEERAVLAPLYAWVLQRVQVDGQSTGMHGEMFRTVHDAVAEARGVISLHGALVVGIEVIDGTYLGDRVALSVELTENVEQVFGDGLVANDDAMTRIALEIDMKYADHTQVGAADGAFLRKGFALHVLKECIGDGIDAEILLCPNHKRRHGEGYEQHKQ